MGKHVDLTLIAPHTHPNGNIGSKLRRTDGGFIDIVALPSVRLGRSQFFLRNMWRTLLNSDPDIVCVEYDPWQVQFLQVAFVLAVARSRARLIVVVKKNTFRAPGSVLGMAKLRISRWGLDQASAVIAASEMTRNLYRDEIGAHTPLLVTQPHLAVDVRRFQPCQRGGEYDALRIGFVGKVGTLKGVPDLITAFEQVQRRSERTIELWFAGAISDAGLDSKIQSSAHVRYFGVIDNRDLHNFMNEIDIFVMPARVLPDHQEHDGRAVLEAMSTGVPCVVSDSGILPELVSPLEGRIFPAGDAIRLAACLEELVNSDELRLNLGSRARERAVATVSPEILSAERLDIFNKTMEVHMSGQSPDDNVEYTARREYLAEDVVENYIPNRFSGIVGRYRYMREQRAVNELISRVPAGDVQSILDCPTGIGRWLPNLAVLRPEKIVGIDVSPTMLRSARTIALDGVSMEFREGVAEDLPFNDSSFDLVFCHALLKHLPESAQGQVLRELARVTAKYVIVAASVQRGPAGMIRRLRKAKGAVAVTTRWFEQTLTQSGLRVIDSRKAATPVGVEYSYLLLKS